MKTNVEIKIQSKLKKKLFLFFIFSCFLVEIGISQPPDETEKLLNRLDLSEKGLEKVNQSCENPHKAVRELLIYFRQRQSVNHPVKRVGKFNRPENIADEADFKIANNALQHIFVGQRAYPPHFCGEDIDWNTRPVPDMEWVWQLNRMYFWNSMAEVYAQTGDEKYAREWGEQLIDWTNDNPRNEDHKYAWRSIEAGIRGHSWTDHYRRFIDSPSFTEEVLVALLNSLYDHAEYLMTVYRSGSNWGLMEAEGLAFIGFTFPEFKNAEKWREEAIRRFNREINIQVYPDGHQRELAIGYHLGCIRWFMRTYELAKMNGQETAFSDSYLGRIEKMCEVPMKIGLLDGTNVQFGDAWAGEPGQHKDLFMGWSKLFGRKDFLYLATDGQKGEVPDSTAYALPASGIYSMRSGWDNDEICLVLKCGPDGGGHCQPDNGTFVVYAGGRNLTPDAGSYIYNGDPEGRRWFRQTKVHQTLTLNGENSAYAPKLLLWEPGETDILVVENQSYENLKHRRSVFFVEKKYFVVVDEAIGNATGNVDIHFQFAPGGDAIFNRVNKSVHTDFKKGWNVHVKSQNPKGLKLAKEEGWVSFEYTKKQTRPAFRYRREKTNENHIVRFVTLVVPYKNEIPELEVIRVEKERGKMELEILKDGEKMIFSYQLK